MDSWLEHFARANFQRSADTAHDLKTPLNVAVLNLELLRMRLRKVLGDEDARIEGYSQAIELELRRMGRIFDAYFLLASPPKNAEVPELIDAATICRAAASKAGFSIAEGGEAAVRAHESRIVQLFSMFFEGASRLLDQKGWLARIVDAEESFRVELSGPRQSADADVLKIFKFYYTDPQGSPDLSLAVARLIAETYGGKLEAREESETISLRLSLPLGAR